MTQSPGIDVQPELGELRLCFDFEQVYREHFPFVWRSLRRLGIQHAHLDDAAQEVFIVVHRRLGEFDGRVAIRSWLFGIAYFVCLNHRRSSRKRQGLQPLSDALCSESAGPHDHVQGAEAVKFLEAFLDSLADPQRSVFILAELEQMTAPEIADALSVKVNTVYSRLRLARAQFRSAVEQRERGAR